jgi:5-methyltetrahydrofolate--homocysteine methyltransferase
MKGILERLKNAELLVGDGAMGTMLFRKGLKQGDPPESVCLEHPEILEDIAGAYLEAGADLIETNTFGGSPLKLADSGLQDKMKDINRIAVEKVRKVVGDKAYVSGSVGSCGKLLLPYGNIEPDIVRQNFIEQSKVLINSGVDLLCIETMIDLRESLLAIEAVRSLSSDIPIIATLTFNVNPQGFYTIMGNDIKTTCSELEKAGADIVGSNCGNGINNMVKIAEEFKKYTNLPVIIQSNAGLPELKGNEIYYNEGPELFAQKTLQLIKLGISIIGGCCGTTPDHIKAIRETIDEYLYNEK